MAAASASVSAVLAPAAATITPAAVAAATPPARKATKKRKTITPDSNWARLRDAAAAADLAAGKKKPDHMKRKPYPPRSAGAATTSALGGGGSGGGAHGRGGRWGGPGKRIRTVAGGREAAAAGAPAAAAAAAAAAATAGTLSTSADLAAGDAPLSTPPSMVTDLSSITTTSHVLAMDCEMVGVGPGGKESALARVSIVDARGEVVLDTHVVVAEPVTDYRTWVSGILPHHVAAGSPTANTYAETQKFVSQLLKGRILVGHALHNDLRSLMLDHPRRMTRDTSTWYKMHGHGGRKIAGRRTPPALRKLATTVLGMDGFQKGEHDSVGDARVALSLYKKSSKRWETEIREKRRI